MGAQQSGKGSRSAKSSNKMNNEIIETKANKENMKNLSKTLLDEATSNKRFDAIEVKQWGNNLINELRTLLQSRYPQYIYCISVYISEISAYVSNDGCFMDHDIDIAYLVTNYTDTLYSEVRVFAFEKRPRKYNFENIMYDTGLFTNINNLLNRHLKGKTFELEYFKGFAGDICLEISELISSRNYGICSYNLGYINKLPMGEFYFDFKIFDAEYYPIFFNYSNNSFNSRFYLFLFNLRV